MHCDCAGASLETGSFEGLALSSGLGGWTVWTCAVEKLIASGVFWPLCVRLVIYGVQLIYDRILGITLPWVVIPVTVSSGVCVCVTKITGHTKAGCQRWVGNCVKRHGEFLHQWWQWFMNLTVGHLFLSLWGPFKNFETGCVVQNLVVFIGQSQMPG